MSDDEEVRILSPEELPDAIKTSFERIYDLSHEKAALKEKYIDPVAAEITAEWRSLKGGADMTRKDLELAYKIFARFRSAADMEDQAEGQRIQDNIKRLFKACKAGETINFLQALGGEGDGDGDDAEGFEDDVAAAEQQLAGRTEDETAPTGPAPVDQVLAGQAPAADVDEKADGPDSDWGSNDVTVPPEEQNDGSRDGYAYNTGMAWGLQGEPEIKHLLKEKGWHHKSNLAKSAKAGWEKGLKRRQQSAATEATSTSTAEDPADEALTHADRTAISLDGYNAGRDGKKRVSTFKDGSIRDQIWLAGYAEGVEVVKATNRQAVKLFGDDGDDNVVVLDIAKPIPLPKLTDDAAVSGGDAA